jgi:hypothetical protein
MSEKRKVELVFREPAKQEELTKTPYTVSPPLGEYMSKGLNIESIHENFLKLSGFTIDEIKLSLEAMVETGKLTQLFVSSKGTGGITITLKPKKQE